MSRSRCAGSALLVSLLLGALLALVPGPVGAAPTADLTTWTTATIPLATGAVAYDETRGNLLVAVDGTVPQLGNHLVEIDVATGAVERSAWIGSDAVDVAVADDGSRAYVGLVGRQGIAEVDLTAFTAERTFPHPAGQPRSSLLQIDVSPTDPTVVAVVFTGLQHNTDRSVVVVDDGVARPDAITSSSSFVDDITFHDADTILTVTSQSVLELDVDTSGVSIGSSHGSIYCCSARESVVVGNRVFLGTGDVIDMGTWTATADALPEAQHLAADIDDGYVFGASLAGPLTRTAATPPHTESGGTFALNVGIRDLIDAGPFLVSRTDTQINVYGPGASTSAFVAPTATPSLNTGAAVADAERDVRAMATSADGRAAYLVLGRYDPVAPDTLLEVDAATFDPVRAVELDRIPVGENVVASVSGDGSTLLLGYSEAKRVLELDLDDLTFTRQVTSPIAVQMIEPVPGTADEYVVSNYLGSAALLSGGAALPDVLPPSAQIGAVAFLDDPTRAYGTGDEDVHVLDLTATGLTVVETMEDLRPPTIRVPNNPSTYMTSDVVGHDGLLYVSDGGVVDPVAERLVGYWDDSEYPSGQLIVDDDAGRLYVGDDGVSERDLDELWQTGPAALGSTVRGVGSLVSADARILAAGYFGGTNGSTVYVSGLASVPIAGETRVASPPRALGMGSLRETSILMRWSAPTTNGGSTITGYRLFRDGEVVAELDSGTRFYEDLDVEDAVPYEYTVTAVNAQGESLPSFPAEGIALTRPSFPDVGPNHPFATEIGWAAQWRIVQGFPNGTFRPSGTVTRQALAAFLYRMYGSPEPEVPLEEMEQAFPDVGRDHAFFVEIAWAADHNLIRGYSDGTFRPAGAVTRQAITAIIFRLTGIDDTPGTDPPQVFPDVPPSHPFFVEITISKLIGLVDGYPDGRFHGSRPVSRQAAAAFLYRFAQGPAGAAASVSGAEAVEQWTAAPEPDAAWAD